GTGGDLLAWCPAAAPTRLDLRGAAEALGPQGVAAWMLEEALHRAPAEMSVLRALAGLYERQKRLRSAVAIWEQIRKAHPTDPEAFQKILDLSASDTIARGNYGP